MARVTLASSLKGCTEELRALVVTSMGRLFEKEYSSLSHLREDPARSCVFLLGGAKIQEAFPMMSAALRDCVVDSLVLPSDDPRRLELPAGQRRVNRHRDPPKKRTW